MHKQNKRLEFDFQNRMQHLLTDRSVYFFGKRQDHLWSARERYRAGVTSANPKSLQQTTCSEKLRILLTNQPPRNQTSCPNQSLLDDDILDVEAAELHPSTITHLSHTAAADQDWMFLADDHRLISLSTSIFCEKEFGFRFWQKKSVI